MVVDAKIWVWTKHRMVLMQDGPAFSTGYIERSEAERLLEEAHKRGYQQSNVREKPTTPRPPPPISWSASGHGHGHVFPNANGVVARCGGPFMCQQCAKDKAQQDAMLYGTGWLRVDATGRLIYQRPEAIAIIPPNPPPRKP